MQSFCNSKGRRSLQLIPRITKGNFIKPYQQHLKYYHSFSWNYISSKTWHLVLKVIIFSSDTTHANILISPSAVIRKKSKTRICLKVICNLCDRRWPLHLNITDLQSQQNTVEMNYQWLRKTSPFVVINSMFDLCMSLYVFCC